MGGQATPRPDSEIRGDDGDGVWQGRAKVVEPDGQDVTEYFKRGSEQVLKIAELYNVKEAILKQRGSSCGSGQIYDGSFSKKIIPGDGVLTALLKQKGIKVISEENL